MYEDKLLKVQEYRPCGNYCTAAKNDVESLEAFFKWIIFISKVRNLK